MASPSSSASVRSPDSASTVRISSPLNPATTPGNIPPTDPPQTQGSASRRGRSSSSPGPPSAPTTPNSRLFGRLTSTPPAAHSSLSLPDAFDDLPRSTFRERSKSPATRPTEDRTRQKDGSPTPLHAAPSSWWGQVEKDIQPARPWRDPPRRKKTVPPEQAEGWVTTRTHVAQAVVSVLGTTADITHEALLMSVDLLGLAPIMGLEAAARTLLNIWDALQLVDMNRLACIRLTERCANVLLSVRQEIHEAGDVVGQELALPISKLEESFSNVYQLLQKQSHRPFLKRYLKRDEILREISGCDSGLRDAIGMFSLSIQIRILKQVQEMETQRQSDTQKLLNEIIHNRETQQGGSLLLTSPEPPSPIDEIPALPLPDLKDLPSDSPLDEAHSTLLPPASIPSSQVLPTLQTLHSLQNSFDAAHDMDDLRQLMRTALQTSSDSQMLEVLQIGRHEMPEAIKTLQRALERAVEHEGALDAAESESQQTNASSLIRRLSLKTPEREAAPSTVGANLRRSKTSASTHSTSGDSSSKSGTGSVSRKKDTLDREFMESGIDALRRMSRGVETNLPSWTITRYEVDRDQKIGIGFFSDVYKGTWRGRTVAIKALAESTPRKLFVHEVEVWRGLHHPNVLELCGASSTAGDPPWFLVSPYLQNGSLVEFLKKVEMEGRAAGVALGTGVVNPNAFLGASPGRMATFPVWRTAGFNRGAGANWEYKGRMPREWDLWRFMCETANGMEYLHKQGVKHGDLKAANVLVDDRIRCVISDFGQSEMKSEAYRISGSPPPHGTLRWQAPELMAGLSQLTFEMDVYAYAIVCVEILTMGRMPWPLMDDEAVRHFVLKENSRPPIPNSPYYTPALQEILRLCWHRDPEIRPPFSRIVEALHDLRNNAGQDANNNTPTISEVHELYEAEHAPRPSPDMRPVPLPSSSDPPLVSDSSTDEEDDSSTGPRFESTVSTDVVRMPEPVLFTPSDTSSRSSSISVFIPPTASNEHINIISYNGYDTPPPVDDRVADIRNERRYRLLLNHDYHPSLTLPLWDPSPVELGAVGYLSKPRGEFITLFNAFYPQKSPLMAVKGLPSVYGYGRVQEGSQRLDKRTVTQRGFDAIAGLITFGNRGVSKNVNRRYSFPLRVGHKTAYMCTETTEYKYVANLDAPKKWFKAQIDTIMTLYGTQHHIQKEDVFMIIGTLRAPNYALFVSHNHPDGHAHFNVYSSPQVGLPWGTFTTDSDVSQELGPSYNEILDDTQISASKVSEHGGPWNAVLLARLRFKPDVEEPTSL